VKPEVAVGAVALRGDELLLVRRGRAPAAGEWSLPGGRVQFAETLHAAVVREVAEETGLEVVVNRFLGWVERIGADPEPYHFVIHDFLVDLRDPSIMPVPGDDAAAVEWVRVDRLEERAVVDGLFSFLAEVGILER
jgi:8-oxo-dGTP diphosphatase